MESVEIKDNKIDSRFTSFTNFIGSSVDPDANHPKLSLD